MDIENEDKIKKMMKESVKIIIGATKGNQITLACCDMSALAVDIIRQNGGTVDFIDQHRYLVLLPTDSAISINKDRILIVIGKNALEIVFSSTKIPFIASLPTTKILPKQDNSNKKPRKPLTDLLKLIR